MNEVNSSQEILKEEVINDDKDLAICIKDEDKSRE